MLPLVPLQASFVVSGHVARGPKSITSTFKPSLGKHTHCKAGGVLYSALA